MNDTPSSPKAVLTELAAWCELAQSALKRSLRPTQPEDLRTFKQHLVKQHSTHKKQLRAWTHSNRGTHSRNRRPKSDAVVELLEGLSASDEYVALSSCALLERAIIAAYERASRGVDLDSSITQLLRRHKSELRACQDHHPRRLQCWNHDSSHSSQGSSSHGSGRQRKRFLRGLFLGKREPLNRHV